PVSFVQYLIETYSNQGETVLDFTMGSGTAAIASKNSGRRFIGIERELQYYKIAKQRVNELGG
ncbi:DNA methyltransferase, partial [Morganella morganii]